MNYIFISRIFNLEIQQVLSKGKTIRPGARITNSLEKALEIIEHPKFLNELGMFSINEFTTFPGSSYIAKGEIPLQVMEKNISPSTFTFFFLREIQNFLYNLWEIKDNNAYVRDGFLLLYHTDFSSGILNKASLNEVFSRSDLSREPTSFTLDEINQAIEKWEAFDLNEIENLPGKYPNDTIFKKIKNNNPIQDRMLYHILGAKASSVLPMKILFYCAALETLFSIEKSSEIAHRVAERVSWFIGTSTEERIEIFHNVKKAYDIRSTVIHGAFLTERELQSLTDLSKFLDSILRQIFHSPNLGTLNIHDTESYQNYFLSKIMS